MQSNSITEILKLYSPHRLGKQISQMIFSSNELHTNLTICFIVLDQMESGVYMPATIIQHWILD
jgi:hypothetical protein